MTHYGCTPWNPAPTEWRCGECSCYSPIGEPCWYCSTLQCSAQAARVSPLLAVVERIPLPEPYVGFKRDFPVPPVDSKRDL